MPQTIKLASSKLYPGILVAVAGAAALPTVENLAENIDVQITDEIKNLATRLENDPIQIYTWVHNNIRFIPSYGSIQGASMTLQNMRGNSFDIAALLSALLRAVGTSTRFVYGTINVPIEKVMNWVGGVTDPGVAQSLLGQGGIPMSVPLMAAARLPRLEWNICGLRRLWISYRVVVCKTISLKYGFRWMRVLNNMISVQAWICKIVFPSMHFIHTHYTYLRLIQNQNLEKTGQRC